MTVLDCRAPLARRARIDSGALPFTSTPLAVLVVDDDDGFLELTAHALRAVGHEVATATDGIAAARKLNDRRFDVVITDVFMPRGNGINVLRDARRSTSDIDVIMISGEPRVSDAVESLKLGAFDYLCKPFSLDELLRRLTCIADLRVIRRGTVTSVEKSLPSATTMIGQSSSLRRVARDIALVATSDAPTLVLGETGTGKELVVRSIHEQSRRSNKAFVAINCASLPEPLLEAEMFGHTAGAYTGANRRREGRLRAADGGTLFFDEVAELPLSAQAKLLRVLQEGVFEPLGSDRSCRVDVRIVAATHRDLRQRVVEGTFREDLFYRLNVFSIAVPSLRERREDLPLLINHFLGRFSVTGTLPSLSPDALAALSTYPFPGNVRELSHIIERAVLLAERGGIITVDHLPSHLLPLVDRLPDERPAPTLAAAVRDFEIRFISRTLEESGGNRTAAAHRLGISRKTLWEKLRRL